MTNLFFIGLLLSVCSYGQATWQNVPNLSPNTNGQRFDDVFFLNETLGWAANGNFAAIYKTTDGGITWAEQLNENDLPGNYYFRNVEFLNEDIGFVGTLTNVMFKTSDGGDSWTQIDNISPYPNAICGIDAIGNSTVYACGAYFTPAHIIKSVDSGDTWEYIDMSAYATALVEVLFINELVGYAAGQNNNGALVLKTTDGGASWNEIYNSNNPGEYVWKLQYLGSNQDMLFGAVYSFNPLPGKLITSTNAGMSWTSFDAPESEVQAVGFISETQGWMGGHNTGFYETLDGGQTWTDLEVGSNLNKIFVMNSNLAYASGTTIYKFTEDSLSDDPAVIDDSLEESVVITKNPVDKILELTIRFFGDDNLRVSLYDLNGKFIKELTTDRISTSQTKTYSFDVSALNSGNYFLDIHNNLGRKSLKFVKD